MEKLLRISIGLAVVTVLLCTGYREAGATPIILNDASGLMTSGPWQLSVDPLSLYRLSLSYQTESVADAPLPAPGDPVAENFDPFYYGLFKGSLASPDYIFENFSNGNIPNGVAAPPITVTYDFTTTLTDNYYLMFFVDNGNPDYAAMVTIDSFEVTKLDAAPVPEPSTLLLLGAGMVAGIGFARRRNKAA